ncbi:DNA/RNA non-specific endonuclease, partial [Listeria booriae]|uniref:DNA/RNA non-specific endonuclease n=2 Tax=Listeria TaxID=1637 RepID=UPI001625EC48
MRKILISIVTLLLFSLYGLYQTDNLSLPTKLTNKEADSSKVESANESNLSGLVYQAPNQVIHVNKNLPKFTKEDLSLANGNWQKFSNLDQLNRVGEANAMLHKSMMPNAEREALYINPTAWKNKKTESGWLYNRCHLIGYQLTGENNNPKNLMTGTRSLNTPGMLDFENEVATYLRKTDKHVRYRITPIFRDNELLARGVQMEAQSIEDSTL